MAQVVARANDAALDVPRGGWGALGTTTAATAVPRVAYLRRHARGSFHKVCADWSRCSMGNSLKSAKFHPPHAVNAVDAHALLRLLAPSRTEEDMDAHAGASPHSPSAPRMDEPVSSSVWLPNNWRAACCCRRPRVRYAPGGAGKLPPGRATTYWAVHCGLNWTAGAGVA